MASAGYRGEFGSDGVGMPGGGTITGGAGAGGGGGSGSIGRGITRDHIRSFPTEDCSACTGLGYTILSIEIFDGERIEEDDII